MQITIRKGMLEQISGVIMTLKEKEKLTVISPKSRFLSCLIDPGLQRRIIKF